MWALGRFGGSLGRCGHWEDLVAHWEDVGTGKIWWLVGEMSALGRFGSSLGRCGGLFLQRGGHWVDVMAQS